MKTKKDKIMKKITGCVVLNVKMACPNGDLIDGSPRTTDDGHGFISSVCAKRQFRELCEDHDSPIFNDVKKLTSIPEEQLHIFESVKKGFKGKTPKESIVAALELSDNEKLKRYIDMAWFGTTCLEERKNKDKKGGSVRFIRTGCIQFDHLLSLAPVDIIMGGITKKAPLRDVKASHDKDCNPEDWQNDIAPDAIKVVQHGLYFGAFYFSPNEASKTHTTQEQIDLFLKLVPYMFSKKSTQRPSVNVIMAMTATHSNALGSFPEHKFIESCRPHVISDALPTDLSDYHIPSVSDVEECMKEHNASVSDLMANVYADAV